MSKLTITRQHRFPLIKLVFGYSDSYEDRVTRNLRVRIRGMARKKYPDIYKEEIDTNGMKAMFRGKEITVSHLGAYVFGLTGLRASVWVLPLREQIEMYVYLNYPRATHMLIGSAQELGYEYRYACLLDGKANEIINPHGTFGDQVVEWIARVNEYMCIIIDQPDLRTSPVDIAELVLLCEKTSSATAGPPYHFSHADYIAIALCKMMGWPHYRPRSSVGTEAATATLTGACMSIVWQAARLLWLEKLKSRGVLNKKRGISGLKGADIIGGEIHSICLMIERKIFLESGTPLFDYGDSAPKSVSSFVDRLVNNRSQESDDIAAVIKIALTKEARVENGR